MSGEMFTFSLGVTCGSPNSFLQGQEQRDRKVVIFMLPAVPPGAPAKSLSLQR